MELRLAKRQDLTALREMYKKIISHMSENGVDIWDEIYPCELFGADIDENRLYMLYDGDGIAAAFALCDNNGGAAYVTWENKSARAVYIDRLGVSAERLRQGIGGAALEAAEQLARDMGAKFLRLFAVDINTPAIRLYEKNGYTRAGGVYEEKIEDFTLREYGFEKRL